MAKAAWWFVVFLMLIAAIVGSLLYFIFLAHDFPVTNLQLSLALSIYAFLCGTLLFVLTIEKRSGIEEHLHCSSDEKVETLTSSASIELSFSMVLVYIMALYWQLDAAKVQLVRLNAQFKEVALELARTQALFTRHVQSISLRR